MATNKKYNWYKIAISEEELLFKANDITVVEVNGKEICVARHLGSLFAFALKCPHSGGMLAEGNLDSLGNIICPVHHYKFRIQNGRNISGEGYYLKHWPVEKREDGIYVGFEESSLFGWLH